MDQKLVNRTAILERTASARRITRLPLRFGPVWKATLLAVDALCVLAVFLLGGLSASSALPAAAIVCAALWLCGAYDASYAPNRRDELYHVATALTLAFVPLWALLSVLRGLSWLVPIAVCLACLATIGGMRVLFSAIREPKNAAAYAGLASISPDAQWRAGRSPALIAKRILDATLAAVAIVMLSPALVLVGAAVVFDSGLPVLFRQERTGLNGREFTLFKFRTMRRDAGSQWAKPGDARITRLGAFLRRASLDELPQFFNVLRGDMSLVGPRPEMCDYARRFAIELPHYPMRHVVKPGITGWAQVHLKRNLDPSDAPDVLAYDLFYVENASPVLDFIVLYKTAAEFLMHRAV
jgi:lipopolysaccharide/colanic/teichoic acid biosynthesis glycosyltransferase